MRIAILSCGVGFGGRGKALLSLCDYLSQEFDVVSINDSLRGSDGERISQDDLISVHSINPDIQWVSLNWDSNEPSFVDEFSPDVVIGFDSETNKILSDFSVPTVAYCRRGIADWADEYWAPSQMAADRNNAWLRERGLRDNCQAIYPIWYIQKKESVKPFSDREYDVLVHYRKSEGVDEHLSDYSVHYASGHPWKKLTSLYENSKVFLFPNKRRFEPLGLMPIEAAAYGCHLSLPRNAGVSEIYPHSTYRRPERAVRELLQKNEVSDLPIPSSPTDPIERILRLTEQTISA